MVKIVNETLTKEEVKERISNIERKLRDIELKLQLIGEQTNTPLY